MSDSQKTRQYDRFASVELETEGGDRVTLSDLRTTFDVRQFDRQSPNTADIFIYNL